MYLQLMEKKILCTVLDFLEAHHIDTTDYRQRAMTIFNNNTTNFSGTINNSGSMAVGVGAQVHNRPGPSRRP